MTNTAKGIYHFTSPKSGKNQPKFGLMIFGVLLPRYIRMKLLKRMYTPIFKKIEQKNVPTK